MNDLEKLFNKIEQEQCWYSFGICNSKAENKAKKPIGSDPMQYCKKHDTEMRNRYASQEKDEQTVKKCLMLLNYQLLMKGVSDE